MNIISRKFSNQRNNQKNIKKTLGKKNTINELVVGNIPGEIGDACIY